VEEARVVDAEQRADADVLLVARGGDRIEAEIPELQPPCDDVDRARERLVLEEPDRVAREQTPARTQRRVAVEARRGLRGLEVGVEIALDDRDPVRDPWPPA
jgi:hypothetical protein